MNQKNKLIKSFIKYKKENKNSKIFSLLKVFMPEIVYRTTKLEGEKISRRTVATLI